MERAPDRGHRDHAVGGAPTEARRTPLTAGATRLSRRGLLLSAFVVVQGGMVLAATESARRRAFNAVFDGFDPLSRAEFYDLVSNYAEVPVPLLAGEPTPDGARTYRFALSEAAPIFLSASMEQGSPFFVHPLIVRPGDSRRYLLPAIRPWPGEREIVSAIQLGRFPAGEHTLTLTQDPAATLAPPSSLVVRAARPEPDSLLARFMERTPVLTLKNRANVLDDVPLLTYSKNFFRHDQTYKVDTVAIFSSENAGTLPGRLLAAYQRTVDIEWVTQQLFTVEGELDNGRQRYQSRDHGRERFAGETLIDHPVLAIATGNNNFADGTFRLLRWRLPNPFAGDDDPVYYAPKPLFLPLDAWGSTLVEAYPVVQRWSLVELTLEGCVVGTGREEPGEAAFFADLATIRPHLRAPFPRRGCRRSLPVFRDD